MFGAKVKTAVMESKLTPKHNYLHMQCIKRQFLSFEEDIFLLFRAEPHTLFFFKILQFT